MTNINIELSFCIPTYNNAKSVFRLVKSILQNEDNNIEVAVLDNGSSDETLSLLATIEDYRLCVYTNGTNKGALFNMMNVLDKGKGTFLVYCTDKDNVVKTKITDFKSFLNISSNIAFGYCLYNSSTKGKIEIYKSGFEALSNLGYNIRHPTGYFFKREFWMHIESVKRFSAYEYVDLFPLEFVFAELSLLGNGAVYHDSIFTTENGESIVKRLSTTTKGKLRNSYFAPECRLKLATNFKNHIQSLPIPAKRKGELILITFYRELWAATFWYKGFMANEKLCIHYHTERRNVNSKELIKIGCVFFYRYVFKNTEPKENNIKNKIHISLLLLSRPKKILSFFYKAIFS